jgi:hypothetical protein
MYCKEIVVNLDRKNRSSFVFNKSSISRLPPGCRTISAAYRVVKPYGKAKTKQQQPIGEMR